MHKTFLIIPAMLLTLGAASAAEQVPALLEKQRELFREAYAAAELGNWQPAADDDLLEGYVLWPDLRAAWLQARLSSLDAEEIQAFLSRHGSSKPARELRYRYALHLARSGRRTEFLDIYRSSYEGLGIATLDCLAVHAGILNGNAAGVVDHAKALWLVGHSQTDECDPVFDYLRGAGLLTETLYRRRYELALAARQYSLARYLARSFDEAAVTEAELWLSVQRDPVAFLESASALPDDAEHRERIKAAIERIALADAVLADEYWQRTLDRRQFPAVESDAMARHIALWYARQHDPDAGRRLDALPQSVADDEVRRWRVRAALVREEWTDVIAIIAAMPSGQRDEQEWQYWLGVASLRTEDEAIARSLLDPLSQQRSYYGFLAADELGLEYTYDHVTVTADENVLEQLSEQPAFIRARELFYVGLETRGRSEWDEAVALLGRDEKVQAALLAHRWGWHSRVIATLAKAEQYDDLELRYPLPWPEHFAQACETARIPSGWAYGVARSESLFTPDIRSRAGAIGLMQLLPTTGQQTASELNLPYEGLATLTDPASNILLGTAYLGRMLERFKENRVVATAAYNAGPARVEKWLPESSSLDARIWIENIPFNETRDYVRRVLVSEVIFNWRLNGRTDRLSDSLGTIGPPVVADAQ